MSWDRKIKERSKSFAGQRERRLYSDRKMGTVYTFKEVAGEQKKPLDYKIQKAVDAIAEGFRLSKGAVGVAFSGGKDSTVLWHLIRTHFPDAEYHVIFGNTTVEFVEKRPCLLGEKL